ncbi:MAG TPA: hypothetical protein VHD90_08340, partial [Phototrophicaceae bacterium]|nr:hypothetical protein [Phototrophicaceae bacterium]
MRRLFLIVLVVMIATAAAVASQSATPPAAAAPTFSIAGEIGRPLPRKLIYDPHYEQFAVVDAYNQLLLIDAQTYKTKATLHITSNVIDFNFSHDG